MSHPIKFHKILTYPSSSLTLACSDISEFDKELHRQVQLTSELLTNSKNSVAVAANQIGFHSAFFIYKENDTENHRLVMNPHILYAENPEIDFEGCLSFPNMQILVSRYRQIQVKYINFPELNEVIENITDPFKARMFQHEIEHLSGGLFIDNLSDKTRTEFLKRYRTHH